LNIVGRAWSRAARRRHARQVCCEPLESWEEQRLQWVREHAPGRSFADIGGLFKLVGDIAFLAEEVGASPVTLFDVGDPDLITAEYPEWGWFTKKKEDRGSNVRYVQGDLEDPESPRRIGLHDVVFYSGVLYHTPNPMLQLLHLREITAELLYLSTLTIPEIPGFPQACVYYPYLDEEARRPYASGYHWAGDLLGIGRPIDERPMFGFGNCYWGMTPSALRSMLRTARFEVVEERKLPVAFATELVCRPLPLDPLLPPVSYFRERAEARERGEERLAFETWYDEARARPPQPR
jgi:hypothetical protein